MKCINFEQINTFKLIKKSNIFFFILLVTLYTFNVIE
jgi:hypothetical protein